ncbi:UPF0468 protein C16orf80-like [Papilio xuthus]|uniref:UPF0468 protein C16orf80-like n=1 Tax=Papilio xuthus TaxID=66420 RepID=A0A194QCX0_PAPXU|nr:UPF0468 protein C16orf80-like [Papilio xuthus]
MPIGLSGGWNQIQFNLADFTKRAYGTQFIETLRVQVHANARIRRIYFCERLYAEEELPQDYKLYLPLDRKQKKGKVGKESTQAKPSAAPPPTPPAEIEKKEETPQPASEPVKQEPPEVPNIKEEKPEPIKEEVIEDIKAEEPEPVPETVAEDTVTEPPAAEETPAVEELPEVEEPPKAELEEES